MMTVNKVVITGATSMIGVALVKECITQGIECLAIVRENSHNLSRLPQNSLLKVIYCDLKDIKKLKLDSSYDVIFNLAWRGTDRVNRYDADIQEENIRSSLDIIDFAKENEIKKIIGIGSQAEYGNHEETITEDSIVAPQSAYGISKLTSYWLSLIKSQRNNINFTWARVFSVYGEFNSKDTLIEEVIENCLNDKEIIISHGDRIWNYTHSSDVARALILLATNGKNCEIYNIANSNSMTIKEYVSMIKVVSDSQSNIIFDEKDSNIQGPLKVDITKLETDTDFKTIVSFQDGIQQLVQLKRR